MSYNYLPLDRKWLSFQQVKNLLDYGQHISITFDAHERILKCWEYLNNNSTGIGSNIYSSNTQIESSQQHTSEWQNNELRNNACGIGDKVPEDIVKLMLMLKIKSLSFGNTGIHIETVKRLMEMYNREVFPIIYTNSSGLSALSHLSLPLIGVGEVYFKGEKRLAAEVLEGLEWEFLKLDKNENLALITGTHFISAYGLYILKKSEQLLKMANIIAALSFNASGTDLESLHEKIQLIRKHKGQQETVAVILKYLEGSENSGRQKKGQAPNSFTSTPDVHGSAKDTFDYVLNVFLQEINSVTENPVIFPEDELVLSGGNGGQRLSLAITAIANAMSEIAHISQKRTAQILRAQQKVAFDHSQNTELLPDPEILLIIACSLLDENKQLSTPVSTYNVSFSDNGDDFFSNSALVATNCLKLVENVEKVLAIELIAVANAFETKTPPKTSKFLNWFLQQFQEDFLHVQNDEIFKNKLLKAVSFITVWEA